MFEYSYLNYNLIFGKSRKKMKTTKNLRLEMRVQRMMMNLTTRKKSKVYLKKMKHVV